MIRCTSRGKRIRIFLFGFVVIVILSYVCFDSYEPLTVSGISQNTQLNEERKEKQVFMHPKLKCMEHATKNTVIMVLNKPSNSLQRKTVRQTWGHPQMQIKYNFSLYFVLGNEKNVEYHELHMENEDVLRVDVNENYFNITEKVIEAFNWATHSCYESRYFLKIDDDVYFHLKFLQEIQKVENYLPDDIILGDCLPETAPFRLTTKFSVSFEEYPFAKYPPYCGGPGYVMTLPTARKLYREMTHTKTFMFEDVYVGIVAYKLGISIKPVDHFVYAMDGYLHYLNIQCAVIIHNLTPELITKIWNERNTTSIGKHDCSQSGKLIYILQNIFGLYNG
ncbi:beta-1,3-galactosyltransferase brn-like [Mizuhopecten yessoensis]|uniref:beta-1,3-galactosyltransferase brn-like n=1 Tax=Mizuhopecten yessoensis TaxID=6573 RepID=UPI000B459001|nr:beta-1,3-galactosyltransferase brn-like [Mizuhopecten yessoensis]